MLLSVNVVGAHLAEHAADAGRAAALQRRMADVNEGWDGCCEEAALWQTKLQTALLEVSESKTSLLLNAPKHILIFLKMWLFLHDKVRSAIINAGDIEWVGLKTRILLVPIVLAKFVSVSGSQSSQWFK